MILYNLSHYLQAWLLLPGLIISLGVLGFIISQRKKRLGRCLVLSAFILLYLLSTPIVAYYLIDRLQQQYPLLTPALLQHSPPHAAIVVLGGGDVIQAEYGNQQAVSDFTLHRVIYAAYLHKMTQLPIIVSGGKLAGAIHSEADLMATVLQDNYQINNVLKEDHSLTTADESHLLLPLLQKHHIDTIYLVTNAWHMPRSVFIFKHTHITIIPAPMGYFIYGPGYAIISFLPNIEALYASHIALHEYMGLAWYHFVNTTFTL